MVGVIGTRKRAHGEGVKGVGGVNVKIAVERLSGGRIARADSAAAAVELAKGSGVDAGGAEPFSEPQADSRSAAAIGASW